MLYLSGVLKWLEPRNFESLTDLYTEVSDMDSIIDDRT